MREAKSAIMLAAAAIVLLSGCSGSQSPYTIVPNGPAQNSSLRNPATVLAALKYARAKIPRDLFVADSGNGAVELLHNTSYRDVGAITSGIDYPVDVFLDAKANLYVANDVGGDVAEYASGNTGSPNFVYSSGLACPLAVTTDAHDNVFVGDCGANLTEYFQDVNHPAAQCNAGGLVSGIAVDAAGDVFASTFNSGLYNLVEYPGGLKNCNKIVLSVQIPAPHGIALDKNDNLLVAAQNSVVVVPPPYSSVSGTIGSGFIAAITVRLNRGNTEAFVADIENETVTIVSYPGGTNITVLGLQNGLGEPTAAVDWPNAVY